MKSRKGRASSLDSAHPHMSNWNPLPTWAALALSPLLIYITWISSQAGHTWANARFSLSFFRSIQLNKYSHSTFVWTTIFQLVEISHGPIFKFCLRPFFSSLLAYPRPSPPGSTWGWLTEFCLALLHPLYSQRQRIRPSKHPLRCSPSSACHPLAKAD